MGLVPMPHFLLYYAVFFTFGALYFDCDDAAGCVGRGWWWLIPLSLFVVFPAPRNQGDWSIMQHGAESGKGLWTEWHLV